MQSRHLFVHVVLQLLGGKGRTISTGIFIFFYLVIFWYFRSTSKSVLIHSGRLDKIISNQFINQFLYWVATWDCRVQVLAVFVLH